MNPSRASSICVLQASAPANPGQTVDSYVDYRDGVLFSGRHQVKKCRSWHSIPAALGTEFFALGKPNWEGCFDYRGVILLVNSDLPLIQPLLRQLKGAGKKVYVAFHENLEDFLNSNYRSPIWYAQFRELIRESDGQWNVIPQAEHFFAAIHDKKIVSCLHGVPYDEWDHQLTIPSQTRKGLMVATRTLCQPIRRNTLLALAVANEAARTLGTTVTYLSEDGDFPAQDYFRAMGLHQIQVRTGTLPYEDWLALIAPHRLLVHWDMSGTLGQVVTDGALVGVPCVGGNSDMNLVQGSECTDLRSFTPQWLVEAYHRDWGLELQRTREKTSFATIREQVLRAFG